MTDWSTLLPITRRQTLTAAVLAGAATRCCPALPFHKPNPKEQRP